MKWKCTKHPGNSRSTGLPKDESGRLEFPSNPQACCPLRMRARATPASCPCGAGVGNGWPSAPLGVGGRPDREHRRPDLAGVRGGHRDDGMGTPELRRSGGPRPARQRGAAAHVLVPTTPKCTRPSGSWGTRGRSEWSSAPPGSPRGKRHARPTSPPSGRRSKHGGSRAISRRWHLPTAGRLTRAATSQCRSTGGMGCMWLMEGWRGRGEGQSV